MKQKLDQEINARVKCEDSKKGLKNQIIDLENQLEEAEKQKSHAVRSKQKLDAEISELKGALEQVRFLFF